MCIEENNTIRVILENGTARTNLEFTGIEGVETVLRKVFNSFLATIKDQKKQQSSSNIMDEMKKAYEEVAKIGLIEEPIIAASEEVKAETSNTDETDDWVKPIENTLDKYNKEFPKLQDAVSRNLYNKLTDLQLNQLSYFVTYNGVLKLQARYSCQCGNFKKAYVSYPNGKRMVRCSECSKTNMLVGVKGEFPCTDEFGNFYVTSNMIK